MCRVMEVADYIRNTIDVDQLKLQKLLYYSQAVYMVVNNSAENCLFEDKIEAWMYGPVVPSVYKNFRRYGFETIPKTNKKSSLTAKQIESIDMVIGYYGEMSGVELIARTHQEDPWKDVYVPKKKHIIITNKSIYNFYKDKLIFD